MRTTVSRKKKMSRPIVRDIEWRNYGLQTLYLYSIKMHLPRFLYIDMGADAPNPVHTLSYHKVCKRYRATPLTHCRTDPVGPMSGPICAVLTICFYQCKKQKSVVPVLPNCAKAPGSVDKNEKGTIVKYKKTASFDAVFGTP